MLKVLHAPLQNIQYYNVCVNRYCLVCHVLRYCALYEDDNASIPNGIEDDNQKEFNNKKKDTFILYIILL